MNPRNFYGGISVKWTFFLCLVLMSQGAGLRPADAGPGEQAATVIDLHPNVRLQSATSEKKTVKLGIPLYAGDQAKTDAYGGLAFLMADGSQVQLGPNTEITLRAARRQGQGDNLFEMAQGFFRAIVSKQGDGTFSVKTSHAVAAVKGTQWQIEDLSDHAEVKVLSGTVQVQDPGATQTVLVHGGEATLSYKDRVAAVRALSAGEMAALRKAFSARVFSAKKDYAERVKKLQGN
jgi:hypothetical protein